MKLTPLERLTQQRITRLATLYYREMLLLGPYQRALLVFDERGISVLRHTLVVTLPTTQPPRRSVARYFDGASKADVLRQAYVYYAAEGSHS